MILDEERCMSLIPIYICSTEGESHCVSRCHSLVLTLAGAVGLFNVEFPSL